jgi:integrase
MKIIERQRYGSRGQGSLIKYAGVANWTSCYYLRGVEHRESTKTPDLKKARAWHKSKLDEIAAGRQGLTTVRTPMASRVTVQTLLDAYLADVRLRELKSVGHIFDHARPVSAHFGTMRAGDVTSATVDRYIETLRAAEKQPATINRQLQILSAAYKLALQRKQLTEVPLIRKLSERGNVRRIFYEAAEVEAVIAAAPEHLKDVIRFFNLTGWRKSEAIGLHWSTVDLAAGTITLPDSKNGRGRVLAISGDLVELMKRREAARLVETADGDVRVSDYVFHKAGRPLGDFIKQWHATLTRAGLSHPEKQPDGTLRTVYARTIHDFRRTAVRNLIRAGVRETVAMAVSGHKTRSMLDRYNITSTDDVKEALEKVSAPSKN